MMLPAATVAELNKSLELPNPETVDVDSSLHAVYALEFSGWLHGHLMKAAGA